MIKNEFAVASFVFECLSNEFELPFWDIMDSDAYIYDKNYWNDPLTQAAIMDDIVFLRRIMTFEQLKEELGSDVDEVRTKVSYDPRLSKLNFFGNSTGDKTIN